MQKEAESLEPVPVNERYVKIREMFSYFISHTSTANSTDVEIKTAMEECIELLERDYEIKILDNSDASLSVHYPPKIPISVKLKHDSEIVMPAEEFDFDVGTFLRLAKDANVGRCRTRFPIPVILFNGKQVCRSATLSGILEIYMRKGTQYLGQIAHYLVNITADQIAEEDGGDGDGGDGNRGDGDGGDGNRGDGDRGDGAGANQSASESEKECDDPTASAIFDQYEKETESHEKYSTGYLLCDELRKADIRVLEYLKIVSIYDLMVEKRKLKYGFYVSSSEKFESERPFFTNFNLVSIPYPGCEFFLQFNRHDFSPEGLHFDWSHPECDSTINVPDNPFIHLRVSWDQFKSWDLVKLTQNYIAYILQSFKLSDSSILIHCISGWDRTPLFISLIRLSLWADGLAHQSLNEHEILYFTLAYDWMLFGHHLYNRLRKKEDVLYFAFDFLKYITSDDFSLILNIPEPSSGSLSALSRESFESKISDASDCNIHPIDKDPEEPFFGEAETVPLPIIVKEKTDNSTQTEEESYSNVSRESHPEHRSKTPSPNPSESSIEKFMMINETASQYGVASSDGSIISVKEKTVREEKLLAVRAIFTNIYHVVAEQYIQYRT